MRHGDGPANDGEREQRHQPQCRPIKFFRDAPFAAADGVDAATLDAEYHRKYDRYGQRIVGTVVGEKAHPNTLHLVPEE